MKIGRVSKAEWSTFKYLGQELLDAVQFPGCPLGNSTAPHALPLAAAR